jgi:lipopolysaccharide export system protein LptA
MTDSFKSFNVMITACMAVLSFTLSAAPPVPISAADKEALERDASPSATPSAALNSETKADLAADDAVSESAAAFLAQANLPVIPSDSVAAPSKPLEVTQGPQSVTISSDGGMYLDPKEGVAVYLNNVLVRHPDFKLSGANEVKIFFDKKSPKPDGAKAKPSGGSSAALGKVKRIVAMGAVLLEQTRAEPGKELIKASGATFSYNLEADQILIRGGFPWVIQGANYLRAKEANLILRISPKAGSFDTEKGRWEMGGDLPKN